MAKLIILENGRLVFLNMLNRDRDLFPTDPLY